MSTVSEPRRVTYSLKNDTSELDRLRSFLRGALAGSAFSELDHAGTEVVEIVFDVTLSKGH